MPYEVGSIVCRFSPDGKSLTVGQIVKADPDLPKGRRWIVFTADGQHRWSASTILRELRDWEEAARVKAGCNTATKMAELAPDHLKVEFEAAASAIINGIGDGSFRP